MARKELSFVVSADADNRDNGKSFFIREMPAMKAERWAIKAFLAMARSGISVPDNIADLGMAGIAAVGIRALGKIDYQDAEPLLDEMLGCVEFVPSPANPSVKIPYPAWESQVEEATTFFKLRKEVLQLHLGFLKPAES